MKYSMGIFILCICTVCLLVTGICTGSNTITHTHTAVAESPGWSGGTSPAESLDVDQIQNSFAAIMGDGNSVAQINNAEAYGSDVSQIQESAALIYGGSNSVVQQNDALSVKDEDTYEKEKQIQSNLIIIIGNENIADQSNTATAEDLDDGGNDLGAESNAQVDQIQSNFGLILGKRTWLYQSNSATAFRDLIDEPFIRQAQRNTAIAINNCEDCVLDIPEDEFSWSMEGDFPSILED